MIRNGHAGFGRGVSEKDHNGTSPRPYLSRPEEGEGAGGEGPLRRRVPRLRRLHPAAQRQGRRVRVLKACHPGAIELRWTRESVLDAIHEWRDRYGRLPSSYDWSLTHARTRGGEARERLDKGEWPSASVVTDRFGTWTAARTAAVRQEVEVRTPQR